jgi:hypothetical protein
VHEEEGKGQGEMSDSNQRQRRAWPTAVALTVCALVVLASPAAAAEILNRPFKGVLVNGKPIPPNPAVPGDKGDPGIEDACGVAVDFEGNIYISDYYHNSIKIYRPKLVGELTDVAPAGNGPCGLAIDFSGTLYVNYWHGAVATSGGLIVDKGPATGVTTDPTTGDVYVTRRNSIAVYESPVIPGEAPAFEIDPGPGGSLEDGFGVAVSGFEGTAGRVYVADAGDDTVKVYDPAISLTSPVQTIDGAGTPQRGFVSLFDASLAIEQSSGHLFVADNTQPGFTHPVAAVDEFNAEGDFRGQLQAPLIHAEPVGLAINEAAFPPSGEIPGELYVTSGNGSSSVFPSGVHVIPDSEATVLYHFGLGGEGQGLTISKSGPGSGTVTSSPAGIDCGAACKAEFNSGAIVTLSAIAAEGSVFSGWSGACTGTGSCQVTMSAAKSVDAQFSPAPALLEVARKATGGDAAVSTGATDGGSGAGLALGETARRGATVTLPVSNDRAGVLVLRGKGVRRLRADLATPGTRVLRLRLEWFGRKALAKSKRHLLAVPVVVSFSPAQGGGATVTRRKVVFRQSERGR